MYSISDHVPGVAALQRQTTGQPAVTVALLDGPVDLSHPCFRGAELISDDSVVQEPAGADDASQHGTHIASLLFGQAGSPIEGLAPRCKGVIIPIYRPSAGLSCTQLDLARAIQSALAFGATIINISGGEFSSDGTADPLLEQALQACVEANVLIVAAAGNHGCACLQVPASFSRGLAVGALDAHGSALPFSNWGEGYRSHGLMAPGENLPGATPGGGVSMRTGTSFATPIVSGVCALLGSLMHQHGKLADVSRIRRALLDTALPCEGDAEVCQRRLKGALNLPGAMARLFPEVGHSPAIAPASAETPFDHSNPIVQPNPTSTAALARSTMSHEQHCPETTNTSLPTDSAPSTKTQANHRSPPEVVACGCQTCEVSQPGDSGLVYALGQIGFDFGTEARRDAFLQLSGANVLVPETLLAYLGKEPASAAHVTWTLMLDATVAYAIEPQGAFAAGTYDLLREFLRSQVEQGVEIVSIPGLLRGSKTLMNGQRVPLLVPDVRGMFSWTKDALVKSLMSDLGSEVEAVRASTTSGLQNFLERIYYEIRNLGISPQERAINYAATNAFQLEFVYRDAIKSELKLDSIDVERSPICRPGSECWDVRLVFFNPIRRLEQARRVYRFTVDVSDIVPVTVGKVRHWDIY
jgi:cyanobactin maturation PatA/PatG family protease